MTGTREDVDVFSAAMQAVSPFVERIGSLFQKNTHQPRYRTGVDRRRLPDRRVSPIVQRLRTGLWLQFHRSTRAGEFSDVDLDAAHPAALLELLLPEAIKYTYADRETQETISANSALNAALRFATRHRSELIVTPDGKPQAVLVICLISEYLCRTYEVNRKDRRVRDRRAVVA